MVLAGPNGAGKSSAAPFLLRGPLAVRHFVNADVIAQGLSAYQSDAVAAEAGRIMLRRLRDLAAARQDFAFETTLASRTFAPFLASLRQTGYRSHLLFLWLPAADMAIERVAERVSSGGHDVPAETVRRRYGRGLAYFFRHYLPLVDHWRFYDNSAELRPRLVASGTGKGVTRVIDEATWERIAKEHTGE